MKRNRIYRAAILVVLVAMMLPLSLFGQDDISIYGVVRDHSEKNKIANVTIVVFENDKKIFERKSNLAGKYEFVLEYDKSYRIEYNYPNYVSKYLTIDVRDIPEEDRIGGFEMNIDMTLFREIEGLDVSLLENPIGKAQFDAKRNEIAWDFAYTEQMQKKILELMREHDQKLQDEQDRLASIQQQFDDLVRSGNAAMSNKKYTDAVGHYTGALAIIPSDESVQQKLEEAKNAASEYAAQQEREEEYNRLITKADVSYNQKQWDNALSDYKAALAMMPAENYPAMRIESIEKIKAEEAEQLRIDAEILALLKAGDEKVASGNFDEGITKYEGVLILEAGHTEARKKIAEAKRLKEAYISQQAIDQQYQELISQADEVYNQKNYQNAIDKYRNASNLKPDEVYPQDQIKKAEELLSLALAEEAKRKKFMEWVNKGDNEVTSKNYEAGLENYNLAIGLFPDDEEVKNKIARTKSLMDNLLAQQAAELAEKEREENFSSLVKLGDQAMGQTNYNDAINYYEQALDIKADNPVVVSKIDQARKAMQDLLDSKAKDEQYAGFIKNGDDALAAENYDGAKSAFKQALNIKPQELYPKNKIREIDALLAEMLADKQNEEEAALDKQFNDLVFEGDQYIKADEFVLGISSYETALELKPGNQMVMLKIEEARSKQIEYLAQMEVEERFKALIDSADQLFFEKNWNEAKTTYNEALAVKSDPYPRDQIQKIDAELARLSSEESARLEAEKQARFASLEKEGDQAVNLTNYDDGISKYNEALSFYPDNQRVLGKRDQAIILRDQQNQQNQSESKYNDAIAAADREFNNQAYADSRLLYQQAINFKPSATYPKKRIDEIDLLLLEMAENKKKAEDKAWFDELVSEGDQMVEKSEFLNAIDKYNQALELFPDDQPVQQKKLRAEQKYNLAASQKGINSQYDQLIAQADRLFNANQLEEARPVYQQAFSVKANDYPKFQIIEIDRLLIELKKRQAIEEARKLAGVTNIEKNNNWKDNTSDEEDYILAAQRLREKELAQSYEELLAYKESLRKTRAGYAENGNTYRNSNESIIQEEKNLSRTLFNSIKQEDEKRRMAEVEMVKELEKRWSRDMQDQHYEKVVRNSKDKIDYMSYQKDLRDKQFKKIMANYNQSQKLNDLRYSELNKNEAIRMSNIQSIKGQKEQLINFADQNRSEQNTRIENEVLASSEMQKSQQLVSNRGSQMAQNNYDVLKSEVEIQNIEQNLWEKQSDVKREVEYEQVKNTKWPSEKDPYEYLDGSLAQKYGQGVTEETYDEGSTKVVKRIVVKGNKVDEYIMKASIHGTYYFKNNFSISQATWNRETEKQGLD